MNYVKIISLIMFLAFNFSTLFSQDKGSFDKTIKFKGEDRTIAFYVPPDYNPETNYQLMVCLHGLGDNSTNFRNALINGLHWNSFISNTILACPDGGSDRNRDFYTPAGDEEIIQTTIDYVNENYNIDTNKIILEGFSLGGRSALKYGLDNINKFYALLLNTPAIQGIEDANNNPLASLIYKYENASKIKIAITHGSQDLGYFNSVDTMYNKLIDNNGIAVNYLVPGMGHSIPGQSYIQKCFDFFNNSTPNNYDLELNRLIVPPRTCSSQATASIRIRNLGSDTVSSFTLKYNLNGIDKKFSWKGNLASFQHIDINLPALELSDGNNKLEVSIDKINSDINDSLTTNNQLSANCKKIAKGEPLPLFEGFEEGDNFPTKDWLINSSGNIFTWMPDSTVSKEGNWSLFMVNTILLFYNRDSKEELLSPVLDLNSVNNPALTFDIAYNYIKYTQPYFKQDTYFADTLEVQISTDCGNTFKTLYKKGGKELATTENPILNPTQLQSFQFIPNADEWRREFIDLSNYSQSTNAVIKFSYISDLGGSIYIDDLKFIDGSTIGVKENITNYDFNIYPNPATDETNIYFQLKNPSNINISLYNLIGQKIKNLYNGFLNEGKHNLNFNIKNLNAGLYFVRITNLKWNITRKLIVK